MSRIFCWLGVHHWGPAWANVLDPHTITYVCICEHCGKRAEGRERRSHERKDAKARELQEAVKSLRVQIAERKRTEERPRPLASELSLTEERDRHRSATYLHDQIGQLLVGSKVKLDTLCVSAGSGELADTLKEVSNSLGHVIQETRTLTFDMSYLMLYELGLEAAVEEWLTTQVGREQGIEVEFEHDTQPKPLDDDIRSSLFRNVQELLVNVGKHAQSHKVKVSICRVDASIHVSVEDDGVGFDPVEMMAQAAKSASFGLLSIRNRLGQLGGSVEIESAPGHGTKITMTAPLKCEEVLTVTQEGAE